jgi:hypothetical protein
MPVVLERWNDDKMDGLSEKVDGLDRQMREQRKEMKEGFDRIDDRFERLYHVLIGAATAIVVAVIGAPHL